MFVLSNVFAQTISDNPLKSRIDSIVQNAAGFFMEDSARVGLSIGIYNNGEIHTYNYGSTEKSKQNLPSDKTIYEVGSISKTFTGLLLAKAVLDNKVKIDDDIRKYLDEDYPNLEYAHQPIKLFHLLNHSSGLPYNLPDTPELFKNPNDSLPFILADIEKNYSRDKFFDDLHKVKIDTVPGIKLSYSNSAAQLLGYILEGVYKMSFGEMLSEVYHKTIIDGRYKGFLYRSR